MLVRGMILVIISISDKYNGCFFKFGVEAGGELSIVNALYRLQITERFYTSGAVSIDSPTPISTPNLKKQPLLYPAFQRKW
jgi:hypothetical protein